MSLGALMDLEGVGQYTANAVMCFSAGMAVPLLDPNIFRVLNRHFGWGIDPERSRKDPRVWEAAEGLVPTHAAKAYHLGLIDVGATVCRLRDPLCGVCPVNDSCIWRKKRGRQM